MYHLKYLKGLFGGYPLIFINMNKPWLFPQNPVTKIHGFSTLQSQSDSVDLLVPFLHCDLHAAGARRIHAARGAEA